MRCDEDAVKTNKRSMCERRRPSRSDATRLEEQLEYNEQCVDLQYSMVECHEGGS